MTPEQVLKFRERAATVRSMVVPGGLVEPAQGMTIALQLDIIDALLADESADLTLLARKRFPMHIQVVRPEDLDAVALPTKPLTGG